MKKIGENYPIGPCKLPLVCICGKILTEDNVKHETCKDKCEICQYCSNQKCPDCGAHICCGGCI